MSFLLLTSPTTGGATRMMIMSSENSFPHQAYQNDRISQERDKMFFVSLRSTSMTTTTIIILLS
jgi:hypothetical protein